MASPGSSHSQSLSAISSRSKPKQQPHPMGITAGAEDVKYHAKYKELKRKVKEVEADNDKLHFKVLNAKRNIQRMKLERAILYERLSQISPSPAPNDRHPSQPIHSGQPIHHSPPIRPASNHGDPAGMDPDPNFIDYSHRATPSRALPAIDTSVGPHNMPPLHRRGSSNAADNRQLPPFNQLPPMLEQEASSPTAYIHDSQERSHSHSSSRSRNLPPQQPPYHLGPGQGPQPQQYNDNYPPMQHVLHSPPLSEREREGSRSRRHDLHELAGTHDPHGHPIGPISPTGGDTRPRIHNHQRMGPGTYINREDREWEQERDPRERELNYSNARQRERDPNAGPMRSPSGVHRSRAPSGIDYPEQHHIPSSRAREEYYHDPASGPSGANNGGGGGAYSRVSRSGTPGSGSGSNSAGGANEIPSRPNSRGGYFDERSRGYRLRPVNSGHPTGEEPTIDFVHEDGRSQSRDRGGSGGFPPQHRESSDLGGRMRESRKNSREMEVDLEMEASATGGGKRYRRASGDNIEDVRMGP
ncbi:hypothetical protein GYMLUDRAFT_68787 [Collybiopsis luxurians FD-317 M1]|nr:hypothetical protein GYMLUDRAFT_68787 [Collybiopsis luxurians FD-317 M1]